MRQFLGGRGWASAAILITAMLVMTLSKADSVMGKQESSITVFRSLQAEEKRLAQYQQDFIGFARLAQDDQSEFDTAMDLASTASRGAQEVHAVRTLFLIYNSLSCAEDRSRIRPVVEQEMSWYSGDLSRDVKEANVDIPSTKRPGVASEAINMRNDLRRAEGIVDLIKLP